MKAGILAAGEGSRLRSEGIDVPKPMVRLQNIPLIERLLLSFAQNGITETVCIINEDSLAVKEYVNSRSLPLTVQFVVESTPSSMHSLFALAPHLVGGTFLLSTVDAIYREEDFSRYLNYIRQTDDRIDGILAITDFIDDENPLYVELNEENRIQGFSKTEQSRWVTGGIYAFSPRIFNEIESVRNLGMERLRNFLAHLVRNDYRLEGFPFSKIVDIDHVHDLHTAEQFLHEGKLH